MSSIFKYGDIAVDLSLVCYIGKHKKSGEHDTNRIELHLRCDREVAFIPVIVPEQKLESMFYAICTQWESIKKK